KVLEVRGPRELYYQPRHVYTAEFLGAGNIIQGTIPKERSIDSSILIGTSIGVLTARGGDVSGAEQVHVLVQPENIEVLKIKEGSSDAQNVIACILSESQFTGAYMELGLAFEDGST